MLVLGIELKLVTGTRLARSGTLLQFRMFFLLLFPSHVGVAEKDHVIPVTQGDFRVTLYAHLAVGGRKTDVVVIVMHGEDAFEERLRAILNYVDSCPPNAIPAIPSLHVSSALVHLVGHAIYGFLFVYRAIGGEVLDLGPLDKDIMVGLEIQSYSLSGVVEGDVKSRYGSDAAVGGQDGRVLDEGQAL